MVAAATRSCTFCVLSPGASITARKPTVRFISVSRPWGQTGWAERNAGGSAADSVVTHNPRQTPIQPHRSAW